MEGELEKEGTIGIRLTMRPMTLWESGESSGDVSIKALFAEPEKVDGPLGRAFFHLFSPKRMEKALR